MKKICVLGMLFPLLVGCNEEERLKALENSGQIPKLERGDTLAGTDANNNGVRDDIENYINKKYSEPKQRAAVIQTAKAMQKTLLADTTNSIDVKSVNAEISNAFQCVYSRFEVSERYVVTKEIEAVTTNTKSRLLAYLAFNKALNGTSWKKPEGDTCE